jgi:hypothetical protein
VTTPAESALAERYPQRFRNTKNRRTVGIASMSVCGMAALVLLVWAALHAANPPVRSQLLGFTRITGTSIDIRFEMFRRGERPVGCTVVALDGDAAIVGSQDVIFARDVGSRTARTVTIVTIHRPVAAKVLRCAVVDQP